MMGGDVIALIATVLSLGLPMACLYTYYRVKKLRSEERLAAIARGVDVPMERELAPAARSRKAGILLLAASVGYIASFAIVARVSQDSDIWAVAGFGLIPLCIGIGYLLDFTLVTREARS